MGNYVQIKAAGLGLTWYDTPAMSPYSGRNRTVLINDASMFRYYFRGTLPAVDFTRCSVIATQFYSTYVLSGDSQYIAKYPIINGNGILMDIRDNYTGAGLCAITHPTVMIIIPKVPNGTPINTRIQKGQQAIYF